MTTTSPRTFCCSRRQALRGAGVAVGAAVGGSVLVACAETTDPSESVDQVTEGDGEAVVALDDVPVGGAVSAEVAGVPVLVTRPAEDQVHLFSAVCTHQGCTVVPAEGLLECPCHRSQFDLSTGEVLAGPADEPLGEVPVTIVDGEVVLD